MLWPPDTFVAAVTDFAARANRRRRELRPLWRSLRARQEASAGRRENAMTHPRPAERARGATGWRPRGREALAGAWPSSSVSPTTASLRSAGASKAGTAARLPAYSSRLELPLCASMARRTQQSSRQTPGILSATERTRLEARRVSRRRSVAVAGPSWNVSKDPGARQRHNEAAAADPAALRASGRQTRRAFDRVVSPQSSNSPTGRPCKEEQQ